VDRKTYALVGFGLMFLKYVVEFTVVALAVDAIFTPLDFLNPTLTGRGRFVQGGPPWLGLAWVLWTIPFLCIAIVMSARRAIDAAVSPSVSMFILVPLFNVIAMLALVCLPTRQSVPETSEDVDQAERHLKWLAWITSALGGIAVSALYGTTAIQASALIGSYGLVMFYGTPFVAGLAAAYLYNFRAPQSLAASMGVACGSVTMIGLGLLLFALEGVVCIMMAAPIILPLACFGGLMGKAFADRRRILKRGLLAGCLALPLMSVGESYLSDTNVFVVTSAVTIDAAPSKVWRNVVDFPEITESPEWFFLLGIACPERARIEGKGVGAIRHCEFTTGEFVEPITIWDEPHRLAFDVTEQPEPMFELTPYRHIHPPHLEGSFRSTRGEFRLVELADGRTRLEGSTWYELKIYPHTYWTLWTDWLVHRIHVRVLRHIKQTAEAK